MFFMINKRYAAHELLDAHKTSHYTHSSFNIFKKSKLLNYSDWHHRALISSMPDFHAG
ncbi:hypothetical protein A359_04500 [secondary endosymbiont of Ctenarytaina eucalypti]|uniref:Uncharacterized protein n=1 Tax=secondary endosymbiont of Ctenarytaina eucalypti TaxID=1199245 RepID=J3YRV2_9ENTR|nr:hypothetical protein A359_04500 [secondary endosymbiont of Ctenarytaina eucalypti]